MASKHVQKPFFSGQAIFLANELQLYTYIAMFLPSWRGKGKRDFTPRLVLLLGEGSPTVRGKDIKDEVIRDHIDDHDCCHEVELDFLRI